MPRSAWMAPKAGSRLSIDSEISAIMKAIRPTNSTKLGSGVARRAARPAVVSGAWAGFVVLMKDIRSGLAARRATRPAPPPWGDDAGRVLPAPAGIMRNRMSFGHNRPIRQAVG